MAFLRGKAEPSLDGKRRSPNHEQVAASVFLRFAPIPCRMPSLRCAGHPAGIELLVCGSFPLGCGDGEGGLSNDARFCESFFFATFSFVLWCGARLVTMREVSVPSSVVVYGVLAVCRRVQQAPSEYDAYRTLHFIFTRVW